MKLFSVLMLIFLLCFYGGCSWFKPAQPQPMPVRELTVDQVFAAWSKRAYPVKSFEASLQVEVRGSSLFHLGRMFGSAGLENDPHADAMALHLLAYTAFGAPGFELISRGDLFELFVPGEGRVYLNVPALKPPGSVYSLSSEAFEDRMFPPGLLLDLLGLLWGRPAKGISYVIEHTGERLKLVGYSEEGMTSLIELSEPGLIVEDLTVYRDGEVWAEVLLSDGLDPAGGKEAWIPRRIEIRQGDRSLILKLSRVRVSPGLPSDPISFREPAPGQPVWVSGIDEHDSPGP